MKMREILFRGKRLHDNKWIYGNFVSDCEGNPHIIEPRFFYEDGHHLQYEDNTDTPVFIIPETVGQFTGLTDRNGKRIFEGDRIIYRHQCKKLIPCDDATQEEKMRYGIDNDSGLGLAYRPTRTIRYKGYVTIDKLCGLDLNLGNRCQWWRCKKGEQLMAVEVIGNIHDDPELLR